MQYARYDWHSHSSNTHCCNLLFFAIPRNQNFISYAYDNIKLVLSWGGTTLKMEGHCTINDIWFWDLLEHKERSD